MNITPLDIRQKQFKLEFRGFSKTEVDNFLEEVTQEFEALMRENEALREDNARLEERVLEFRENEKTLRDTLVAAQKISEEMKAASDREAQLKLQQAEMDAEKLVSEAKAQLAKTEEEIAELGRIKERFRISLRGMIEEHLKMLVYEDKISGRR